MSGGLFGDAGGLAAAEVPAELHALASDLDRRFRGRLHLGTSSWSFPGWNGLVWGRAYGESTLAKRGLTAYARHPLLRTVSLDRAFYRPLEAAAYTGFAAQVPEGFRFIVKAPALVTDATVRDPANGKALRANPLFLDPRVALAEAVTPAVQGLGPAFGVLVFQLSPLPLEWLADEAAFHARLDALWRAVVPALPASARAALEVRDPELLTPALAKLLQRHGVRYCAGLHDRMPPVSTQLPMLRAMWPGDLVCRWNLQRGLRYAQAKGLWEPFDRIQAPDLPTREALARVIAGTLAAGFDAYVGINNKAEGSAPCSVIELAREVLRQAPAD
ncbi:DUF72 domain-containing protein [Aquincola sp. MAHUQ-54]|uniref:DUF72 domain-containing protein n=1 Tax=Aquincola agrisoli TaxID=3119538 RepID=A0AAW9QJP6_9BURK